ncbi:MAG: response regulator [Deltaproteobacteria bacterium]|nr:response regulator [Deltaproteobacteria bacterium]
MREMTPRILVVDDTPENLYVMRRILEPLGVHIVEAGSGEEALARLLEDRFAVVLMDVQMPEMDGFETASLILDNPKTSCVPIVFVTALNTTAGFVSRGYESGAVDYLLKPLDENIVRSKVRVFLKLFSQQFSLESAKRELVRSNRELEEFALIVSHDLKAPLRHIGSYIDNVLEDEGDSIGAQSKEYLKKAQNSCSSLSRMLDGLREYAVLNAKPPAFATVKLEGVLQRVIDDVRENINEANAVINLDIKSDVYGEEDQIYLVFLNLISNALKYRKESVRPHISVVSEICHDSSLLDISGPLCKITVSDNGIGFEGKYAESIFKPFKRLVSKSQFDGTGIGLSTVFKIIKRHRGSIVANSAPGEGATFCIALPID